MGGVDVKTDITKDYIIKVAINIDRAKINLDEASNWIHMALCFQLSKNLTPKQYVNLSKQLVLKKLQIHDFIGVYETKLKFIQLFQPICERVANVYNMVF